MDKKLMRQQDSCQHFNHLEKRQQEQEKFLANRDRLSLKKLKPVLDGIDSCLGQGEEKRTLKSLLHPTRQLLSESPCLPIAKPGLWAMQGIIG